MSDPDVKPSIPIDSNEVVAPLSQSKSFASNLLASVILPVIWPLLPDHVKLADWLPGLIGATYLIVNAVFREMTRTRAKAFVDRLVADFDLPSQNPTATVDDIKRL